MKEHFKSLIGSMIKSVLLPFSIVTGNTQLFEAIVFSGKRPTIHNDQSTFEEEVEKSKVKVDEVLKETVSIEDYDNLYAVCGIQPINSSSDEKTVYTLAYKNLESNEMSLEIKEADYEANAVSLDNNLWNDIVKLLQETTTTRTVSLSDYSTEEDKEKALVCEMQKDCNTIAFETRRGAGNTVIVSEDSVFEVPLLYGLESRAIVSKSNLLGKNEVIIGYRGNNDFDCGAILTLTNDKDEDRYKYGIEVRDNFFKRILVEEA